MHVCGTGGMAGNTWQDFWYLQKLVQVDTRLTEYFRMEACRAYLQYCACVHYNGPLIRDPQQRETMLEVCKGNNKWLMAHVYDIPGGMLHHKLLQSPICC
jgi:hypothetical protein